MLNEHLNLIFEKVIPALSEIDYWVYGGIAIAGFKNDFFRENNDMDIFVYEKDYLLTTSVIRELDVGLTSEETLLKGSAGIRPKMEFFIKNRKKDVLSIIPVYELGDDKVKFIYKSEFKPKSILTKIMRTIGNYKFITPSDEFIREQFIRKIGGKLAKHKELSGSEKKDARTLFGDDYLKLLQI
jgi:hypothetical protein